MERRRIMFSRFNEKRKELCSYLQSDSLRHNIPDNTSLKEQEQNIEQSLCSLNKHSLLTLLTVPNALGGVTKKVSQNSN